MTDWLVDLLFVHVHRVAEIDELFRKYIPCDQDGICHYIVLDFVLGTNVNLELWLFPALFCIVIPENGKMIYLKNFSAPVKSIECYKFPQELDDEEDETSESSDIETTDEDDGTDSCVNLICLLLDKIKSNEQRQSKMLKLNAPTYVIGRIKGNADVSTSFLCAFCPFFTFLVMFVVITICAQLKCKSSHKDKNKSSNNFFHSLVLTIF